MRLCLCRPTVSAGLRAYVDNLPEAQRPVDGRIGAGAAKFSCPPPFPAVVDTVAATFGFLYPPDIIITNDCSRPGPRPPLTDFARFFFFFFLAGIQFSKTVSRWCAWTYWAMLSSQSTTRKSVANARSWSGRVPKSSSSSWKSWWATVSESLFVRPFFSCPPPARSSGPSRTRRVFLATDFYFLFTRFVTIFRFKILPFRTW